MPPDELDFAHGVFSPHPDSVHVGVAAIRVACHPARLMTSALGSCVGVAMWDPTAHVGALGHIMLPAPGDGTAASSARYAEWAVPEMIRLMVLAGAQQQRIKAKIAGGAAMFTRDPSVSSIGDRNVEEVKRQLECAKIELLAEDTGQRHARTVELALDTGILLVHSHRYGTCGI